MFKIIKTHFLLVCLSFFSQVALAADFSLTGISGNVVGLLSGFNNIADSAFIVVGTGLLCGAALQYRNHRNNPSQVRLIQPIILLLCGICLIMLPFLTSISDGGKILSN